MCWRQRFSFSLVLLTVHPASLSPSRPDSTQFRRLGKAAWASLGKLASATPTDWPKRLAAVGRPDSHPLDCLARQPGLAWTGWRTLRSVAGPVCPSTAGCRLSRAVETGSNAAWADPADRRALRSLPCPSLLMARASDRRPLQAGTSAAQAEPGNWATSAPLARPVGFAAVGRPDANPPDGLATWTGPTPATWPTSGPLAAPVHSTLRADPNPHPKQARDRPCWSGTTAWAGLPGRYTVRGRPAPNPGGGRSSAARAPFLAPFNLRSSLHRTHFDSRGNAALCLGTPSTTLDTDIRYKAHRYGA